MTLGTLDRRSLLVLLGGLVGIAILRFGVYGDHQAAVVGPTDSIPMAEKRLQRLREIAATVGSKEAVLKQATAELESREKGMLKPDTVPQAQALAIKRERMTKNTIQITGGNDKKKNIQVRLSLSGVVPRKLIPERRGASAF